MTDPQFTTLIHEIHILQGVCGAGLAGVIIWQIIGILRK